VARYLSAEWFDAVRAAASASESLREATTGVTLTVAQVVTDGPDGDVAFHVTVDDGRVDVGPGAPADATVTFTQDYDTATRVAQGELSAQGAFMTGRIRVHGDLPRLVRDGEAFARIDDVMRSVRDATDY
jgi:putative sterol carrier protein